GMSANLLSMGAVDFGVIVDGGVVIIEAILARMVLARGMNESVETSIRKATTAVVRPTVFALLIIIAAYLPIFLLQRVEGRLFAPMANTVVWALGGALFFSVPLVRVLAALVWRKPPTHGESPVLTLIARRYDPTLRFCLRHPALLIGSVSVLVAAAALVLPRLGSEFLPELNEGALYMTFTLPANTSLTEGRKLVPRITQLLQEAPQVESVLSQLGRPEDGTDPKLANNLEFFVKLIPPDRWPRETPTLGSVLDVLQRRIAEIPGIEVN